ncbi:SMI1/KNR4 family protein [Roseovarius sp. S88]|uniref:SMI1/KNR4 family protein n=2 Tax=Roseovarius phycicola TaxID=3080976 RepID=A0ABZ2HJ32_9RHOB
MTQDFRKLCETGLVSGGVCPTLIAEAQETLGVVFPAAYREFLEEFGAVMAKGFQIYGIIERSKNDPPMWQQVVDECRKLREWQQVGTERRHFIPISDDGMGVYFFLDTDPSGNGEVHAVGPGVDQIISKNLDDFAIGYALGRLQF